MNEIKIKSVDETVYNFKTKCGLDVYIWPYDLSDQISLSLNIKYGSIHTEFKIGDLSYTVPNGIAHFLEHLKFNIKKDLTAHDLFNKLGSYVNAYTTFDHTSYEVICTNNIKDNLLNLLDFVYNPYFTKDLIKKEKPIVMEEAKSVLDNPYNKGYFTLSNNTYNTSKYKNLIVGSEENIKNFTIEDVQNVYDGFYHPNNSFLIVTGNINPYEIEKIVDQFFIDKPFKKKKNAEIKKINEKSTIVKKYEELNANVSKEKILLALKYSKKLFKNYTNFDINNLVNIILMFNIGNGSFLKENLQSKCIIDDLYYYIENTDDAFVIYIEVSTDYPKEVERKLFDQLNNLEVTNKDFELQMKVLTAETILGYDDAAVVNNKIKRELLFMNKIIDNRLDIYKSYSIETINNVISILKKYNYSEVLLKPSKKS